MKTKIFRNIVAFALALIYAAGAFAAMGVCMSQSVVAQTADSETTTEEESYLFDTYNRYNYRMDSAFTSSPDSFEAWIYMDQNSVGGTIMGNWVNNLVGYDGSVDWEIDALGRIRVFWNNGALDYTVRGIFLNDATWHHVAIVRDPAADTFTFYLDGSEVDSLKSHQKDAVCNMPMQIGVDYKNWTATKTPFDGKIREITVYNGAISPERVRQDMTDGVQDTLNGQLIGNWVLGDTWTQRHIEETFGVGCGATISTFEKFVSVMPTGDFDYTLAILPDIQTMVKYNQSNLYGVMDWLVDQAEEEKIAFAIQVGDLSDNGTNESLYATAASAMSVLDDQIPYSFIQGNHDYDDNCSRSRSSVYYNKYFPYSKYSRASCFGGAYEEGDMANWYALFETCGVKYVVINLEFAPRREVIRWAGRVCEMYPNRRVIVNTHAYVDPDGTIMDENARYSGTRYAFSNYVETTTGQQLYDGLIKRYPNIFLTFNGHNCTDDLVMRRDVGIHGNTITSILVDPQCTKVDGEFGVDPVLLMKFNETAKTIDCIFYSPKYDKCLNIQSQFTISFADENNPTIQE